MSAFGNSVATLLVWYAVAIVTSIVGGLMALFDGRVEAAIPLLYGSASINSFVASVWFGIRNRSWKLLWGLPALLLPFAFVLVANIVAGPITGPDRVDVPGSDVKFAGTAFIVLTVLAIGVMAWGMRPHWANVAAIGTFCVTLSVVALWLGNAALTHMVS
jgi:hypothetical protein